MKCPFKVHLFLWTPSACCHFTPAEDLTEPSGGSREPRSNLGGRVAEGKVTSLESLCSMPLGKAALRASHKQTSKDLPSLTQESSLYMAHAFVSI